MKKTTFIVKIAVLFLCLTAFKCEDHKDISCSDFVSKLESLRTDIQNLAETSICNENFKCRYIALGSKPCGGPWRYLIYTTSVDTLKLHDLVEVYNAIEREYNVACQQYSDCMHVSPPVDLECQNNTCKANSHLLLGF